MRVNCPDRVNYPKTPWCQIEVTKMSKKTAVTYDQVFRFLNDKNERYAEGCTEIRKRINSKVFREHKSGLWRLEYCFTRSMKIRRRRQ